MVPVSDYVKKLLFQYDCLVVPELGGFILRYLPAEYAEGTETYLPPRKKVAFNEALKLDDGLLLSYMMLHEGRSREEVSRHIRAFVEEVKRSIRSTGSFQLEGVGLFTENEEGHLQFDPELRHNFSGEAFGFQPLSIALVGSLVTEETGVYHPAEEITHEEDGAKVLALSGGKPARQPYWRWVAAVLLIGSVGVMSYFTFSRVPGQLASSLNPFDVVWTIRDISPAVKPEAPTARPVAVKAAPVQAVTVTQPVAAVSPVVTPQVVEKTEPVRPKPKTEPTVTVEEPVHYKYLAIAGSFSSKKNARKFERQLRRKGYREAFIVNPDARKGLIKVAAFGFNKRSEVEDELAKVTELTGTEAWISRNQF